MSCVHGGTVIHPLKFGAVWIKYTRIFAIFKRQHSIIFKYSTNHNINHDAFSEQISSLFGHTSKRTTSKYKICKFLLQVGDACPLVMYLGLGQDAYPISEAIGYFAQGHFDIDCRGWGYRTIDSLITG